MKKTGGTKKWGEHRTRIIKLNIKFAVKTWAIRGKRRAKCWAEFRRIALNELKTGDLCRVRTKCLKCPAGTGTRICAIITVRTSVPSGSNMFRR